MEAKVGKLVMSSSPSTRFDGSDIDGCLGFVVVHDGSSWEECTLQGRMAYPQPLGTFEDDGFLWVCFFVDLPTCFCWSNFMNLYGKCISYI